MENGDRLVIDHPENIAFDPPNGSRRGSEDFYVINGELRLFSTFEAVSSVTVIDRGEA
jgi:hypothetical protein